MEGVGEESLSRDDGGGDVGGDVGDPCQSYSLEAETTGVALAYRRWS